MKRDEIETCLYVPPAGAQQASGGWAAAAARWGGKPAGGAPPPPGQDDGNFGATQQQLPPGVTSDTRPLLAREDGAPAAGGAPGGQPAEDYSKYAFYNIKRYRPYFDVDTKV
jgi:hypothetical protein